MGALASGRFALPGPAEEFAAMLRWLGRIRHVEVPGDRKVGNTSSEHRPVMEAEFADGMAFLVDVRVKASGSLVMEADHVRGCIGASRARGMPLLMAWKRYSRWRLVEIREADVSGGPVRLTLDEAEARDLLPSIAGDTAFFLDPRVSVMVRAPVAGSEPRSWLGGVGNDGVVRYLDGGGRPVHVLSATTRSLLSLGELVQAGFAPQGYTVFHPNGRATLAHELFVRALHQGEGRRRRGLLQWLDYDVEPRRVIPSPAEIGRWIERARREGFVQDDV